MSEPLIQLKDVFKVYPSGVLALNKANISVRRGEIHSVIGENGAGKSTLMNVLYGITPKSSGSIMLEGQPVHFTAPREAVKAGVGMVHQEFMLIPSYTVHENVILGAEPRRRFGAIDKARSIQRVAELIENYHLDLDPEERIADLSVAAQQKVEILKLLYRDVEILILDEPTAVLTPQEIRELFKRLVFLKGEGKTILFISHKLDEVLELSDTITVMRKGEMVVTLENKDLSKAVLARAMVGREVVFSVNKTPAVPGETVLLMDGVVEADEDGRNRLHDLSVRVRSGEIVGIAGVEGNGQLELVQSLTGIMRTAKGKIFLENEDITDTDTPDRRRRFGFVPQNRKTEGSSQLSSLVDNSIMTHHRSNERFQGRFPAFLSRRESRRFTRELIEHFGVITSGPNALIKTLSGGNQQKVIVGRESMLNHKFLLLDQPTRGLDVGSIEYIQKIVIQRRDEGTACLLISADLDELLALSDRILVLYRGRIVADLEPGKTSREEIGEYMLGAKGDGNE